MKNSFYPLSFIFFFFATSISLKADTSQFSGFWKNQTPSRTKTVASIQVNPQNSRFAAVNLTFSGEQSSILMHTHFDRGALIANNVHLGCEERYQVVFRMMRNNSIQVTFRPILEGKPQHRSCGFHNIAANLVKFRRSVPTSAGTPPNTNTQRTSIQRRQNPRTSPVIQYGQLNTAAQGTPHTPKPTSNPNATHSPYPGTNIHPATKQQTSPNPNLGTSNKASQSPKTGETNADVPAATNSTKAAPHHKKQAPHQTAPIQPLSPPKNTKVNNNGMN